uniref:Restriction endonuclease S subunit n=1 Tax=Candidatus Kentrum sp. TUN TaxID=2126343 RepID=A0A450ZK38_9GAMM|nr:MAG: Restriction endonuclease S subunit [Candidatus Kentron sp. TUN]
MSFELSPEMNRDKVFLVGCSELEGRLDPMMAFYQRKIAKFKHKAKSFSDLLMFKPQYGASEAGIDRQSHHEPRYIRITDIDEYGLLKDGIGKTARVISHKYYLNNNDLLFARSGATVGKSYIHKEKEVGYPCFYAGYMIRFVIDERKVDPNYVFAYTQLSTYRDWIFAIQRAAGQPNINAAEYKALKIPVPPEEIQFQIAAKMDLAYASKKQKEAEAQRLLDSIDNYLLEELGIELPEEEENTVESRIFIRRLSEISGGRFDPEYYKDHYRSLEECISQSTYEARRLVDVTYAIYSGNTPSSGDYAESETTYPIIKVSSYEGDFISPNKLAFTLSVKGKQANQFDIFVLSTAHQAEYVGRSLKFLDYEPIKNTSFVGELLCIRANKKICNSMYLFSVLKMHLFGKLLNREKTGQTSHIYSQDIKHISVPFPTFEKQTKIANHITQIRNRAKQLQQEAKAGLERTKREVEAMILDEEATKA